MCVSTRPLSIFPRPLHATMAEVVLRQLHELIQADFAKNHLKALKCFVEVDLLKCDRLLSQL
jgi:hypothetical protein